MDAADYRQGDEEMNLRTFLSRWHWQPDTRRTQHVRADGGRLRLRSIFAVGALVAFAYAVTTSGVVTALAATSAMATSGGATALAVPSAASSQSNFGPCACIFKTGLPHSEIQSSVGTLANHAGSQHC